MRPANKAAAPMAAKDDGLFGATPFGMNPPLSANFRTLSEKNEGMKKPTMK
jgi:hypothetical protein